MKKLFLAVAAMSFGMAAVTSCQGGGDEIWDSSVIPYCDDGEYSYMDVRTGKRAVGASKYDSCSYFVDGIAIVSNDGELSYIDRRFNPISKKKYAAVTFFRDGVALVVEKGGHIQLIDKEGKTLKTLDRYEFADVFTDGYSVVKDENLETGLIDAEGNEVFKPGRYSSIQIIDRDRFAVARDNKKGEREYGIVDREGNEVSDFSEKAIVSVNKALASRGQSIVSGDKYWELVDKDGNALISGKYTVMVREKDGSFVVRKERKSGEVWGWLDSKGDELIEPRFDRVGGLFGDSSLAPVYDNDKDGWGFIDRKGEWVVKPRYDFATGFNKGGLAVVSKDSGKWGAINEQGDAVIPVKYGSVIYIGGGMYAVTDDDDETAILDSKGEVAVKSGDYEYSSFSWMSGYEVADLYVNVDEVVKQMVDDLEQYHTNDLSLESLEVLCPGKDLEGYGWKDVDSWTRKGYDAKTSAFADYNYSYSCWDTVREDFTVSFKLAYIPHYGKYEDSRRDIFNAFAKKIGASCRMDKDGNISGDRTFQHHNFPGCTLQLTDFAVEVKPDSGRFQ